MDGCDINYGAGRGGGGVQGGEIMQISEQKAMDFHVSISGYLPCSKIKLKGE